MEEDEYRSTYKSLNQIRCIYEKALNSRRVCCSSMRRIYIADREAVGCESIDAVRRCEYFLDKVRVNARFALQLTAIDGPLPHNKEIKVQVGGIQGLQQLVWAEKGSDQVLPNAVEIIDQAEARYGSVDNFPYSDIMPAIAQAKGRERRNRRGDR